MENGMAEYLVLFVLCGALGGFLSGLLGIGGGTVYVPALYFVYKSLSAAPEHAMHVSVATSLAVIFCTLLVAAHAHYVRGAVEVKTVLAWLPALLCGTLAGSVIAAYVSGAFLKSVFLCLNILVGIYMALGRTVRESPPARFMTPPVRAGARVLVGMVGPLTGLGGGVLAVPVMLLSGLSMQKAVGVSSVVCAVMAAVAAGGYVYQGWGVALSGLPAGMAGYVCLPAVACLVVSSLPMAELGVKVAHRVDQLFLRRVFAAFLFLVSAKMAGVF